MINGVGRKPFPEVDGLHRSALDETAQSAIEKFTVEEGTTTHCQQLEASGFIDGLAKRYPAK